MMVQCNMREVMKYYKIVDKGDKKYRDLHFWFQKKY